MNTGRRLDGADVKRGSLVTIGRKNPQRELAAKFAVANFAVRDEYSSAQHRTGFD